MIEKQQIQQPPEPVLDYPEFVEVRQDKYTEKFLEYLDPEKSAEYLEQTLRGYRWDSEKEKWVPMGAPLLNEKGIKEIMSRIRPLLVSGVVAGNLTEDKVNRIVEKFAESLALTLIVKYKDFEIKEEKADDIRKIINLCSDVLYITLLRSEHALTLKALISSIKRVETENVVKRAEEEKKEGFFSKLFKR